MQLKVAIVHQVECTISAGVSGLTNEFVRGVGPVSRLDWTEEVYDKQ